MAEGGVEGAGGSGEGLNCSHRLGDWGQEACVAEHCLP